ncbi:hypothetical protein METHPM2_130089 [Pseudomonas sp. PM2]
MVTYRRNASGKAGNPDGAGTRNSGFQKVLTPLVEVLGLQTTRGMNISLERQKNSSSRQ